VIANYCTEAFYTYIKTLADVSLIFFNTTSVALGAAESANQEAIRMYPRQA
jgi:hypothetical protein